MKETVTLSLENYEDIRRNISNTNEMYEELLEDYNKLIKSLMVDEPLVLVIETTPWGLDKRVVHTKDEYVAIQRGYINSLEKSEKELKEKVKQLSKRKWWQRK